MKKLQFLTFAAIFLFAINASAQTITIPDDLEEPVGEFLVPVDVDFSEENVGAFELRISYDGNVLDYKGITNEHTDISGASSSQAGTNPIVVTWASSNDISPEGKLFDIEFEGLEVGTSSLTFVNPNTGATDGSNFWEDDTSGSLISTTFNNGFITVTPAIPLSNWALAVTGVLIAVFVFFRMRRIM